MAPLIHTRSAECQVGGRNIVRHLKAMQHQIVEVAFIGDSKTTAGIRMHLPTPVSAGTTTTIRIPIGAITGTYTANETVTETTSGATGYFVAATAFAYIYLVRIAGTFTGGKLLTGGSSGATSTGTTAIPPAVWQAQQTTETAVGDVFGIAQALQDLGVPWAAMHLSSGGSSIGNSNPVCTYGIFASGDVQTGVPTTLVKLDASATDVAASFDSASGWPFASSYLLDHLTVQKQGSNSLSGSTINLSGVLSVDGAAFKLGPADWDDENVVFAVQYARLSQDNYTQIGSTDDANIRYAATGGSLTSSPVAGTKSFMRAGAAADDLQWFEQSIAGSAYSADTTAGLQQRFVTASNGLKGPAVIGCMRNWASGKTTGFGGVTTLWGLGGASATDALTALQSISNAAADNVLNSMFRRVDALGQPRKLIIVIGLAHNASASAAAYKTAIAGIQDLWEAHCGRNNIDVVFKLRGQDPRSDTSPPANLAAYTDANNELAQSRDDTGSFDWRTNSLWSYKRLSTINGYKIDSISVEGATSGDHIGYTGVVAINRDDWGGSLAIAQEYKTRRARGRGWR